MRHNLLVNASQCSCAAVCQLCRVATMGLKDACACGLWTVVLSNERISGGDVVGCSDGSSVKLIVLVQPRSTGVSRID